MVSFTRAEIGKLLARYWLTVGCGALLPLHGALSFQQASLGLSTGLSQGSKDGKKRHYKTS